MAHNSDERIRKVILGITAFFGLVVVASGIFLFFLLFGGGSQSVELTLTAPAEATRGVPFDVTVAISNTQEQVLKDATVNLDLPKGAIYLGVTTDKTNGVSEDIGDVGVGSIAKRTYKVIAVDPVGSKESIRASISYTGSGRSRFNFEDKKEVAVTSEGVEVTTKMPDQVLRGSTFEFEVNYKNISKFDFPDLALKANYPDTFHFESASFPPDEADSYWRLGELRSNSVGKLLIKGTYMGSSDQPLEIPVVLNAQYLGHDYPIAESSSSVALAPSPVSLSITVNNQDGYVARAGDKLTFTIHYENKSGIALADTVLTAALSGDMIDYNTLQTNAQVNDISKMLTWNSSNVPVFKLLDAGAVGDVTATVSLKNLFPIERVGNKNYSVKAFAEFSSPSVPYYVKAGKTVAAAKSETKIVGLVALESKLYFRDADANVVNLGPFPPKVGMPTEYTVHWRIRNFSTDLSNVVVHAPLAPNVIFASAVKSSLSALPAYDASTGLVTWNVGKVSATKGVVGDPLEAVFKVRAMPAATDARQFMQILGESSLTSTDDFTGLELDTRAGSLSTVLSDDPTVGQDGGRVIP